jgi:molybdate transport system ATP-binding protein
VLEIAISHRLGGFTLDAAFTAGLGVTALFGRSGSGKTTVVNAIAGLLMPDQGRIAVGGRVLLDTGAGLCLPAHRRRIGYVFQEARLFPHLTVGQNLLFGRWVRRLPRDGAALDRVVDLLGLAPLLDRRPRHLSGGERQRVAIGRALLAEPALLLLDEPLAGLDAQRREEIIPFLERLRDGAGIPMVLVSHQMEEVERLAGTLVLMAAGRVLASGPLAILAGRSDLMPHLGLLDPGVLLPALVAGFDSTWGLTRLDTAAGPLTLPGRIGGPGAATAVRVRGRDVLISLAPPEGLSARNALPGIVAALAPVPGDLAGAVVQVTVDCAGHALMATVTAQAAAELGLRAGVPVWAVVKAVAVVSPPG